MHEAIPELECDHKLLAEEDLDQLEGPVDREEEQLESILFVLWNAVQSRSKTSLHLDCQQIAQQQAQVLEIHELACLRLGLELVVCQVAQGWSCLYLLLDPLRHLQDEGFLLRVTVQFDVAVLHTLENVFVGADTSHDPSDVFERHGCIRTTVKCQNRVLESFQFLTIR